MRPNARAPRLRTSRLSCPNGTTHEASINALAGAEITRGCTETSFCAADEVTRAQMATFLVRAFDHLVPSFDDRFTDDSGSTHETNINGIADGGVTLGCNADGTLYCPGDPVRRDQMATFLGRALGVTPLTPPVR